MTKYLYYVKFLFNNCLIRVILAEHQKYIAYWYKFSDIKIIQLQPLQKRVDRNRY